MPKTIGNFYLKLTDSGNLIGEYSNAQTNGSLPESAWRQIPCEKPCFAGEYKSTWYDSDSNKAVAAELKITPRGGSFKLFDLVWSESGTRTFQGQAMLCDGMLVGNYHSPD